MDSADGVRLGEDEQVVVAAHLAVPGVEARTAVAALVELELLNHGAHGAVEHQDALGRELAQFFFCCRNCHCHCNALRCAPSPQMGEGWGEGDRAALFGRDE